MHRCANKSKHVVAYNIQQFERVWLRQGRIRCTPINHLLLRHYRVTLVSSGCQWIRFYVLATFSCIHSLCLKYFVHLYLSTHGVTHSKRTVISLPPRVWEEWLGSHWLLGESLTRGVTYDTILWFQHFPLALISFLLGHSTRSTLGTISLGYASCEGILLFKACLMLLLLFFIMCLDARIPR